MYGCQLIGARARAISKIKDVYLDSTPVTPVMWPVSASGRKAELIERKVSYVVNRTGLSAVARNYSTVIFEVD